MQIIFSMTAMNTKVVDNFYILLVLNFFDFRPADLGVMDVQSWMLEFAQIWTVMLLCNVWPS
jgi:hypothetical protein